MKHAATIALMAATLVVGGCVFAPGAGDRDRDGPARVRPTIGQELLDLDRARDEGVITEGEYERTKERILDNVN